MNAGYQILWISSFAIMSCGEGFKLGDLSDLPNQDKRVGDLRYLFKTSKDLNPATLVESLMLEQKWQCEKFTATAGETEHSKGGMRFSRGLDPEFIYFNWLEEDGTTAADGDAPWGFLVGHYTQMRDYLVAQPRPDQAPTLKELPPASHKANGVDMERDCVLSQRMVAKPGKDKTHLVLEESSTSTRACAAMIVKPEALPSLAFADEGFIAASYLDCRVPAKDK